MRAILTFVATFVIMVAVSCSGEPGAAPTPAAQPTAKTAVALPTTSAAVTITGSRIEISDVSGAVGEVKPVRVVIMDAKTGVSGYAIVVSVADPTVGRITNVSLPEFGLTIVGDLPAASVDITAADLPGLLEGDIKEARLATLDIEMLKAGTTELLLEVRSVDDDEGNIVQSQVRSGTLSVN